MACYAISEEIWGEAEKLLKDIPEDKLTTKAYQALADIAGSQNNPEVVKNYLEKLQALKRDIIIFVIPAAIKTTIGNYIVQNVIY